MDNTQAGNMQNFAYFRGTTKAIRKFHVWPGNVKFPCCGRCVQIKNNYLVYLSVLLIVLPYIIFWGPVTAFLATRGRIVIYIVSFVFFTCTIVLFTVAATRDPGIIDKYTSTEEDYYRM